MKIIITWRAEEVYELNCFKVLNNVSEEIKMLICSRLSNGFIISKK